LPILPATWLVEVGGSLSKAAWEKARDSIWKTNKQKDLDEGGMN
jgi:hypothetical protein